MTTMRERIVRAISDELNRQYDANGWFYSDDVLEEADCGAILNAVLAELEAPTLKMTNAALDVWYSGEEWRSIFSYEFKKRRRKEMGDAIAAAMRAARTEGAPPMVCDPETIAAKGAEVEIPEPSGEAVDVAWCRWYTGYRNDVLCTSTIVSMLRSAYEIDFPNVEALQTKIVELKKERDELNKALQEIESHTSATFSPTAASRAIEFVHRISRAALEAAKNA